MKKTNNENFIFNLINKYATPREDKTKFLNNEAFVNVIRCVDKNLNLIRELNFLEDCNELVLNMAKNNSFKSSNFIIRREDISEYTSDDKILAIFDFFEENSVCVVVEPNYNSFLDIDYKHISSILQSHISVEAYRALLLFSSVQERAIIDNDGCLIEDKLEELKQDILISCDFEKNSTIFSFCCNSLNYINDSLLLYKK